MDARPAAAAHPRGLAGHAGSLLPFFCLSVTFGTTLGFLSNGAPLILRARGVVLTEIGLLQLITLPVGLTFLWAPVIDRLRLPGLPHRIGWIAATQAAAAAVLALLGAGEAWPLPLLLALAVAASLCMATMDVAMEALVVETVPGARRPLVTSAKFCGASLGGIVGAGLLITFYDALGWRAALLVVVAVNLLCLLPILRYPEERGRRADARPARAAPPPAPRPARWRRLAGHAAILALYFASLSVLSSFNNLALLDLGVPLATIGLVTGTVAPGISLAMAALAGPLVGRFGTLPLITAAAGGLVAAGGAMAAAAASGFAGLAVAATLAGTLCAGGLGVPVFSMIYRWAQGPRPATDYALLFGTAFFAAMPARVAAPALAGAIGWPAYFAAAIPLFAAAFAVLRRAIARTLAGDGAAA
ncbi:MFS transporter [Methylobacterium sp. JK268]